MSFINNRRALIFSDGGLYVQGESDTRRGREWCTLVLGLTEHEWATSTRGYMTSDRIVFFRGEQYEPALNVTAEQVKIAQNIHQDIYGCKDEVTVFTGVVPGEPGDAWDVLYMFNPTSCSWDKL